MYGPRSSLALLTSLVVLASCGEIPGPPVPSDVAYSIVVLPDTQYYSSSWPEVFDAQTRWIVEHREAQHIAFVLHTGDIVDHDDPMQWDVASMAMHRLDGEVPYVVTAGNHDYTHIADRMGMGNVYFPPSDFEGQPWFGGTFEPGHIENSFSLFDVPGGRWLVIALEFGPRDEALAWAGDVLRAHADTPAIVITHAYLYRDGTRYDHVGSPGQQYNPHDYVMMDSPTSTINDGEEMWTKLIRAEPQCPLRLLGPRRERGGDPAGDGRPPRLHPRGRFRRPSGVGELPDLHLRALRRGPRR